MRMACYGLVATVFTVSITSAGNITLISGNGIVGGTDSLVHMLIGPSTGDFAAFSAADFAAAQTGPSAFIINPNTAWITSLPANPSAQWIGTNANANATPPGGNTALYAISFNLVGPVSPAFLTLNFAVDDRLGGANNRGVFVNGTAPDNFRLNPPGFGSQFTYNSSDIGALLTPGTNWLYIDAVNNLNSAGLMFSSTITTGVPEPETFGLIVVALGTIGVGRRRCRS
jgi:hypothetical protein